MSETKVYDLQNAVTEVLLVLERQKIPLLLLDDVLDGIREAVMQQPITAQGTIGVSLQEYEEYGKELLQKLEAHRRLFPEEFSS